LLWELINAWQNGLFYSKCMIILWLVLPVAILTITKIIEEDHM